MADLDLNVKVTGVDFNLNDTVDSGSSTDTLQAASTLTEYKHIYRIYATVSFTYKRPNGETGFSGVTFSVYTDDDAPVVEYTRTVDEECTEFFYTSSTIPSSTIAENTLKEKAETLAKKKAESLFNEEVAQSRVKGLVNQYKMLDIKDE